MESTLIQFRSHHESIKSEELEKALDRLKKGTAPEEVLTQFANHFVDHPKRFELLVAAIRGRHVELLLQHTLPAGAMFMIMRLVSSDTVPVIIQKPAQLAAICNQAGLNAFNRESAMGKKREHSVAVEDLRAAVNEFVAQKSGAMHL